MKEFFGKIFGMAILAALVLCGIGSIGYLIYDHHYLFAIATLVVVIFAAPSMYREIQKRLLL